MVAMKLDTSFFKKNKKLMPLFIGGGVLLLGVIVFVLYWFVLGDVKPSYVRVTNQTDSSFTVSWVSTKKSKGQVLVREDEKFLPGVLAPLGADKFYDDRDVVKAELEAGEKRTEKAAKEVEDSEDKVIDVNNYNFDVKVRKQGRYYVHTVTVSNLDADTEYSFRIGNGLRWYGDSLLKNNVDRGYDFGALGLETMKIRTLVLPEDQDFFEPSPSYGSIEMEDAGLISENILLFSFYGDTSTEATWENLSLPLSSGLNEDLGWYIDQANARFENGYLWGTDDSSQAYQMLQILYVIDGQIFETNVMSFFDYELRPAPTLTVGSIEDNDISDSIWSFSAYAGKKTTKGGTSSSSGDTGKKTSKSEATKSSVKAKSVVEKPIPPQEPSSVKPVSVAAKTPKSDTPPSEVEKTTVRSVPKVKETTSGGEVKEVSGVAPVVAPPDPDLGQHGSGRYCNGNTLMDCTSSTNCSVVEQCTYGCKKNDPGKNDVCNSEPQVGDVKNDKEPATYAVCSDGNCVPGQVYADGRTCVQEEGLSGGKVCTKSGGGVSEKIEDRVSPIVDPEKPVEPGCNRITGIGCCPVGQTMTLSGCIETTHGTPGCNNDEECGPGPNGEKTECINPANQPTITGLGGLFIRRCMIVHEPHQASGSHEDTKSQCDAWCLQRGPAKGIHPWTYPNAGHQYKVVQAISHIL